MTSNRLALLALTAVLAACGRDGEDVPDNVEVLLETVSPPPTTFLIEPGPNATQDMLDAIVAAIPGDTIEFACGFFDLTAPVQLAQTENITIKGCGRDKTVLSFKDSQQPVGILAHGVRGLVVQDLTVADTDGDGFQLRAVDHGTLRNVRAFWSSGGGNASDDPISKDNYTTVMNVACTDPATQNPNVPENDGGDTSSPDYTVSDQAGRYGIYPVSSSNILVDNAESIGASDAGIYVGQTSNAIIKNSRAVYNVFGFEIENVIGGEYSGNISECNTGGFLIYDLDGNLRQYGDRTRMFNNIARKNNTYNFTEGGFVANVPPGSGMITLSYDRIEIFDNEFRDNNTGGIIHTSYAIFPENERPDDDRRIDFYSEGVRIYRNKFFNNGNSLPPATTSDLQNGDTARVLPALVGLKNQAACGQPQNAQTCANAGAGGPGASEQTASGFRGAHILWDGLADEADPGCAYPKKTNGEDVPMDERGKPLHTNQDDPDCHYNLYKFDKVGTEYQRKLPDWWFSCIDADNQFSSDSLAFANFRGTKGANAAIKVSSGQPPNQQDLEELEEYPSSFDQAPHRCVTAYGRNMPLLPPIVIPQFVPSDNTDRPPTAAEIEALCTATVPAGKINFGAAKVNCPTLQQYNLFSNPEDPRSAPNKASVSTDYGDDEVKPGMPFVLNTKLFSDFSVKYRVLFLPQASQAIYRDAESHGGSATIDFPVGTIIAKSFAFVNEGVETMVETRLLIKRINNKTREARWDGLPYIWGVENGKKVARLSLAGGSKNVSWNFRDVDSNALHAGTTDYQIPNANQCLSCHSRRDAELGSAPIGLKVRNLNRPYAGESPVDSYQKDEHAITGVNQIAFLCQTPNPLMQGCPSAEEMNLDPTSKIAKGLERLPIFNKLGDGGTGNADIEARARAYLEVNCQHCHNLNGFAESTGLYLDAAGPVGLSQGMCKKPTATGAEGSGGNEFDIVPGNSAASILAFRMSNDPRAQSAAARMPPLARSTPHGEGHALIAQWIDSVIVRDNSKYPNSEACGQ